MDTTWLKPALQARAPYVSVHLDVSRETPSAREVELRWARVREQLERDGAPSSVVDAVAERALAETGLAGEQGRSIVATAADGVVLDRVLARRPLRDSGHFGLVPHLMPAVRALDGAVSYALVEVDRTGADVTLVDSFGHQVTGHEVEGGHDVLHKFGGGGWSHRRFQMRVEDSWERNAAAVARDLDRVVAEHRPELVLVTGDLHARSYVHRHASGRVAERLVDVEGGGRADGVSREALAARVEEVLSHHRLSRMGELVARFEAARGRGGAAADGLAAVVEALRGGAVGALLLADDPGSTARLWAGDDPLQLGTTADEVLALGAQDIVEDRADAVLLRALVAQDGEIELVEGVDLLTGGIGALLRFDVRPAVPGRP